MASPDGTISNDTRGWILCAISAIACVAGAGIVCVDIFIRMLPGKKSFNIQDSSAFLSSSLSLSFGVMIFSSLFSMLPSSKRYLVDDGLTDQAAGLLMISGFALGFVGMQIVSRIIHRFMPSHVVDCDHTHEDDDDDDDDDDEPSHSHAHGSHGSHGRSRGHAHHHGHDHEPSPSTYFRVGTKPRFVSRKYFRQRSVDATATESTPLLATVETANATVPVGIADARASPQRRLSTRSDDIVAASNPPTIGGLQPKRSLSNLRAPSMFNVRNRVISFVQDIKSNCDEFGPCYGYTDPCGQECKRTITIKTPTSTLRGSVLPHPPKRAASTPSSNWEGTVVVPEVVPEENGGDTSASVSRPESPGATGTVRRHRVDTHGHIETYEHEHDTHLSAGSGESSTNVSNEEAGNNTTKHHGHDHDGHHDHDHDHDEGHEHGHYYEDDPDADVEAGAATGGGHPHHHHVPANAFLSIGLQTVLAIGLHKFPEGFITFATNHANPALGFNVFMALFVHNIAEGFAMALPLYMALGSRLRAILWAAALGGLSQPLGAGCAALWLKYMARNDNDSGDGTAYGILFAVTAGIMVAVSLQLFVESLTLHHNRQLTVAFAFLGMMLLGISNAIGTH
ncbi:zip metal ion transporter [Sporothrix brasiliensis 5110]|uniref:Zip metal ion transporter n=1 Tax=Sporothrix brasiliensis 5110 TaxID=1398154 RepID=A0A0C2EVI1_9PEZI|nr:zip metal ion transporter [Sporothrix brasiliensis 5110]KIH90584.1 zip metal ion transporter [Sporothrix brasiliensis 5110]